MTRNYLVVSSEPKVRELLAGALQAKGYTVTLATTAAEAIRVVKSVSLDAVLVESTLADGKGKSLRRKIARKQPDCHVVIFTNVETARAQHLLLGYGEEDYVLTRDVFVDLVRGAGVADDSIDDVQVREVKCLIEVVDVLVGLLEMGDDFFGGSSHRVMRLSREIAQELSVEEDTLYEVILAALLRDVGKGAMSPRLLAAPGEYSESEREALVEHIDGGVRLLEHIDFPWKIRPVIRHHHERYDGRGYPEGLKGREIPLGSRILTVADAYVAMTSDRPHRTAMPPAEAQEELVRHTGSQFDPEVVEAALRVLGKQAPLREGQSRFNVLVAEPDEEYRNLIRLRLLGEGHDVVTVADTDAALQEVLGGEIDLVVSDVRLPGGEDARDAFHLLDLLRSEEGTREVPFAFLSAHHDRVSKVRALRLGVDDFIVKADDMEEVGARIENILTREVRRRGAPAAGRRRGLVGRLDSMPLADLTQALSIGMKTAKLALNQGKVSGVAYFERGQVCHARCGDLEGEAAFYEMLSWGEGSFVLEHGVQIKRRTVEADTMFLLMEGMRQQDEAEARASGSA
jgi:response regulator RpfG family c-di-GMP phosphodiesterase